MAETAASTRGVEFDSDDHVVIQYHTYRDKRGSSKKDAQGADQAQGQGGAGSAGSANEGT